MVGRILGVHGLRMKVSLVVLLMALGHFAPAQVKRQWVSRYNYPGPTLHDTIVGAKRDAAGIRLLDTGRVTNMGRWQPRLKQEGDSNAR